MSGLQKVARMVGAAVGVVLAGSASPRISRAQVTIDSLSAAIDSRYVWRNYDRGGYDVRTAAAWGLLGFSTNHSSNELNDLRLEVATWNALTDRAVRDQFDQYLANLHYGRCIAACDNDVWNKRWSVAIGVNQYALPNATGKHVTTEAEATLRGYWDWERRGSTQLGINLSPVVAMDWDFARYSGVYAMAGLSTFLDAIGPFSVEVSAVAAASDWPCTEGTRSFGFHGAELRANVMRDFTFGNARHAELAVGGTLNAPADDIGPVAGFFSVRLKLIGPIFK